MKPLTHLIDSTIAARNEPEVADILDGSVQARYQRFLRRVLIADALARAGTGLFLALGAAPLSLWFGLPAVLLREAGIFLLPFAALVAYIATRTQLSRRWVWVVVIANTLWVIDSIVLLLSGWVTPSLLGQAFVLVQALVVAVLAELEYVGLQKSSVL